MREIKFRSWDYGSFRYISKNTDLNYWSGDLSQGPEKSISEYGWEQYTGLKDKNGKEIYDGDIFDIGQTVNGCSKFIVEWDRFRWSARYAIKMNSPRLYEYALEELFDLRINNLLSEPVLEIIGNIHENKELTK